MIIGGVIGFVLGVMCGVGLICMFMIKVIRKEVELE